MPGPISPSPYNENDLYGRVSVCAIPIEHFNGTPGYEQLIPDETEIAVGKEGEFYIVYLNEDNEIVIKSFDKKTAEKIGRLESSGIFDLSRMFLFNRRVNHLMFYNSANATSTVINIPESRIFPVLYKYWALKSLARDGGDYISNYVDTSIGVSNLIPMDEKDILCRDPITNEEFMGKFSVAKSGNALENLHDKEFYAVEFYDKDKYLVEKLVFQAIDVKSSVIVENDTKLSVKKLIVKTNRDTILKPKTDGNAACYLYEGEPNSLIHVFVQLQLSDGTILDITHLKDTEWFIDGLDEILTDSTHITGTNAQLTNMQTFTVEYRPKNGITTETSGSSVILSSISKKVEVFVFEDVRPKISKVVPVVWYKKYHEAYRTIIKFHALYKNGETRDVTNQLDPTATVAFTTDFFYDHFINAYVNRDTTVINSTYTSREYDIVVRGYGISSHVFKFMFELDNLMDNMPNIDGQDKQYACTTYCIVGNGKNKAKYNVLGTSGNFEPANAPEVVYDIHQMYTLRFETRADNKCDMILESDSVAANTTVPPGPTKMNGAAYKTKYGGFTSGVGEMFVSIKSAVKPGFVLVNLNKIEDIVDTPQNNLGQIAFERRREIEFMFENSPCIVEFYKKVDGVDKCVDIEVAYLKHVNKIQNA